MQYKEHIELANAALSEMEGNRFSLVDAQDWTKQLIVLEARFNHPLFVTLSLAFCGEANLILFFFLAKFLSNEKRTPKEKEEWVKAIDDCITETGQKKRFFEGLLAPLLSLSLQKSIRRTRRMINNWLFLLQIISRKWKSDALASNNRS
jgi:hypothetical protein